MLCASPPAPSQPAADKAELAGHVARLVECLPSMHEAKGSIPTRYKLSMVVHTCNPSTGEAEERERKATVKAFSFDGASELFVFATVHEARQGYLWL